MTRHLDPATALNIPVQVELAYEPDIVEVEDLVTGIIEKKATGKFSLQIIIRSWDRHTDSIRQWVIDADNRDKLEMVMHQGPLSDDDVTWLSNIGARLGIAKPT